ncbi:MAG: M23 family metallopeptidase [Treponema sp.]|jgi:murein DD-endopeptidase MepM/ murein hydrolase activator NlpD|nr:M23 family metallopeptidase [Treponema sp.]
MKQKSPLLFIMLLAAALPLCAETIHVIQKGETVYSVARSYGVNPTVVLTLNGMTESDAKKIRAGQRLKIPASPASYGEYRVSKNETFYSISRRYNISVEELLDMNGFSPAYVLKEGEKIRIPLTETGDPSAETGVPVVQTAVPPRESGTPGTGPLVNSGQNAPVSEQVRVSTSLDGGVRWPVGAKELSYMTGKLQGVMITGNRHEPVRCLARGTVVSTGPYRGFGRVAIVQASGGYLYVYGGCETLSVKEGDRVEPGTELGKLGVDPKSEKPRLFFLVYRGNNPVDPAKAPRN